MHHRPRTSYEDKCRGGGFISTKEIKPRKSNQSRKQYSLRSKAKEQKKESDIGVSEIPSMSSRKPTSTMETNEIPVCAKSVRISVCAKSDMKAPTEQTGNQHDNSDNNYMGSIADQAVKKLHE